jgi:hypothetical protein
MHDIVQLLEKIKTFNPIFANSLRPGVDDNALKAFTKKTGKRIPQGMKDLYKVANGSDEASYADFTFAFRWMSLEEVADLYPSLNDFDEEYQVELDNGVGRLIPFLVDASNAGHMCFVSAPRAEEDGAVSTGPDEDIPRIEYVDITDMLQQIVENYQRKSFLVQDNGSIDLNQEIEQSEQEEITPFEDRAIETLLGETGISLGPRPDLAITPMNYCRFSLYVKDPNYVLLEPAAFERLLKPFQLTFSALGYETRSHGHMVGNPIKTPQHLEAYFKQTNRSSPQPTAGLLNKSRLAAWTETVSHSGHFTMGLRSEVPEKNALPKALGTIRLIASRNLPLKDDVHLNLEFAAIESGLDVRSKVHALLIRLLNDVNVVYGLFEYGVDWNDSHSHENITECFNDRYKLSGCLRRLTQHMVFQHSHLACSDISQIPLENFTNLVKIGRTYYCRFAKDPLKDKAFAAEVEQYFNMLPLIKRKYQDNLLRKYRNARKQQSLLATATKSAESKPALPGDGSVKYCLFSLCVNASDDAIFGGDLLLKLVEMYKSVYSSLGFDALLGGTLIGMPGKKLKIPSGADSQFTKPFMNSTNLMRGAIDDPRMAALTGITPQTSRFGLSFVSENRPAASITTVFGQINELKDRSVAYDKGANLFLSLSTIDSGPDVRNKIHSFFIDLISELDVVCGMYEEDVPWIEKCADFRNAFYHRWMHYYTAYSAQSRIDEHLFKLAPVLVFSKRHLACSDVSEIPDGLISELTEHNGLYYCKFAHDPNADAAFAADIAPYFKLI